MTSEKWHLGGSAPEIYAGQLVPAIFGPWAPVLVERARLESGQTVLDLACGTGVVARLARSAVGESGQVTGADLNSGMLATAEATAERDGIVDILWEEADATAMPFESDSFDIVLCQLGLQYFPDKNAALGEVRRVLKDDGRAVFLVWRSIDHSPGFDALANALGTHVSPEAAAVMHAPFVFGDQTAQLRGLFTETGYREVRIDSEVRMVRFGSTEDFIRYQVGGSPLAGHLSEADDDVWSKLVVAVEGPMSRFSNDEGVAWPIQGHIVSARK